MGNEPGPIQLIDERGKFNVTELEKFIQQGKLVECGLSYRVVSIIGPQSSGKSTLLNHLFGTNFKEMDAYKGRSQTTKGIWLARAAGIEPCCLVMDLEGTDGSERGEDDTTFEKQSSLFALAVSDTVLINMWCHDIGREHAANKPLLKIVFQVMMQLFSQSQESPHQKTLMFVIRDKSKTPLEILQSTLTKDVQKIWESVAKPQAHKETQLSKFFNVEVVALPSYEKEEQQFKEQVADLRQKYSHFLAPGGLSGNRKDVVPASGLSFSLCEIWKKIEENKDLDLPTHKVMVAIVRCEEIAKQEYSNFAKNEQWLQLLETVLSVPDPNSGRRLRRMYETSLLRYDKEAMYFDAAISSEKKEQLGEKLVQLMQPAIHSFLEHLRSAISDEFKEAFDKTSIGKAFSSTAQSLRKSSMVKFEKGWADASIEKAKPIASEARKKLQHDINLHIASVCDAMVSELTSTNMARLTEQLSGPVEAHLHKASDVTWPNIRMLLRDVTKSVVSEFSNALLYLSWAEQSKKDILKLQDHARYVVESTAKKEAGRVLEYMIERFKKKLTDFFISKRDRGLDIEAVARTARSESLKLLSVMVAIRLDDNFEEIDSKLFGTLLEPKTSGTGVDPLASSTWEKIPSSKTLITPVGCKDTWVNFMRESDAIVDQITRAVAAYHDQGSNGHFTEAIQTVAKVLGVAASVASIIVPLILL